MKIGQERIDDSKSESRPDEEFRLVRACFQFTSLQVHRRLQRSDHGGAHGDDPPPPRLRLPELGGRLFGDKVTLRVHPVLLQVLRADWQERAGPNIEGNRAALNAAPL